MTKDQLLPKKVLKDLLPLDGTGSLDSAVCRVKFFYPDFSWTWYPLEFDGKDTFWGLVDGFEKELGTFSLRELMENRGKLGCEIERDYYFQPTPLRALMD